MQKLAKREEQIMQALWTLEKAFVKEIIALLPDPKPHYNSVSTMVRILVDKGLVDYEAYGKTHQYYPLVGREDYQKLEVKSLLGKYFGNSYSKMVAHFAQEENISKEELENILKMIQNAK